MTTCKPMPTMKPEEIAEIRANHARTERECCATGGSWIGAFELTGNLRIAQQAHEDRRGLLADRDELIAERDSLTAKIARMEEALKPFAEMAKHIPFGWEDGHSLGEWALGLDVGDLRRAASAVEEP